LKIADGVDVVIERIKKALGREAQPFRGTLSSSRRSIPSS